MRTDDLIRALAEDAPLSERLEPALTLALAAGLAVAAALFVLFIGVRSDLAQVAATPRFAGKLAVVATLAATAGGVAWREGRPGSESGWRWSLLAPVLLLGGMVAAELVAVPEPQWMGRLVGHSAGACLLLIPLLSAPILAAVLAALRRGAPDHPGRAGAIAGLAAAGLAATLYATHCTDDSPLFVAVWYPAAAAIVATAGYFAGRRWLVW
jgi:hypothetical protein